MVDTLLSGQKMQIRSVPFNDLIVINDSSYTLDITPMHNNIMNPMVIIRNAVQKDDKATDERLKKLEGMEAGS